MEPPPILTSPAASAPPTKVRTKNRRILLILASVLLLSLLGLAALFRKKEPAIPVQTDKVGRHTITETVIANGKIYPVLQVHISPEVSGEIIELAVKEGQFVHKGDMLLKINPDLTLAGLNQAKAGYESSLASKTTAAANLEKAEADFKRNKELFDRKLLSESDFIGFKVARDVAQAQVESADDQVNVAKAAVDSAQDALNKTTIVAPLDGTITKLNSQLGERVLGTVQNAGTDIMIISDLSAMEARVDIGEMDIVLLQPGEKATLEVDSFKDKKFEGVVTDVANSSEGLNAATTAAYSSSTSSGQSATQFQVRIRFTDVEQFRPGMSVSATIATRTHTNTLAVPIASITTRLVPPKSQAASGTNAAAPPPAHPGNAMAGGTNSPVPGRKAEDLNRPVEVVFVVQDDHVKTVPVKIGISDDNFWEITDGLNEGDEIVTGGYHAISHDLDDGRKISQGAGGGAGDKPRL